MFINDADLSSYFLFGIIDFFQRKSLMMVKVLQHKNPSEATVQYHYSAYIGRKPLFLNRLFGKLDAYRAISIKTRAFIADAVVFQVNSS